MCKYMITCEGLYVPSIWLWKGFTSSPSRNHGAVRVQVPEIMAQNGCCTSLPWTSDTFSFGLTSWQLPQSCLRCSRAMFRKFWTCLEDCTKWTGSKRSCILVKELGLGIVGVEWVNQAEMGGTCNDGGEYVFGGETSEMIYSYDTYSIFLVRAAGEIALARVLFDAVPEWVALIMRILFGWWQNKATLPLPMLSFVVTLVMSKWMCYPTYSGGTQLWQFCIN